MPFIRSIKGLAVHDTPPDSHTVIKVIVAWIGATYGSISLSDVVLLATLAYTLVQIYFTVRDKWWRDRVKRKRRQLMRRKDDL